MKSGNGKASGGPSSKQVRQVPVRTGTPARGVSPGGVNQLGTNRGNHATDAQGKILRGDRTPLYGGPGPTNAAQKLGNEIATNVGKGGPGAGRTLHGQSGSQHQYGAPEGHPRPEGRGILNNE
jgi:hypothetical protein